MHADAALSKPLLDRVFPGSRLTAEANLLIMPNLDAANITYNALKIVAGEGITVGPILLGAASPAHVLTPTSTVRRLVNMTALTRRRRAPRRPARERQPRPKRQDGPQAMATVATAPTMTAARRRHHHMVAASLCAGAGRHHGSAFCSATSGRRSARR